MKCPNCGNNISELDEICPKCNLNFDDYEEEIEEKEPKFEERKSQFLIIMQIIIIGIVIITSIMIAINENYSLLILNIISGVILYIILNIGKTIIDLLQSIDEKLDK